MKINQSTILIINLLVFFLGSAQDKTELQKCFETNQNLKYSLNIDENEPQVCVLNNKYGFINKKLEVIVPFIYDKADAFNKSNLAIVELNGKKGLIDKKGNVVIPIEYDAVSSFKDMNTKLISVKKNLNMAM